MDSWKTLTIVVMALISNLAAAAEKTNPFDQTLMYITFVPSTLVAGTASVTTEPPMVFKSAKTDALAFIGSDGEIRGVQFERASRHYRSTYGSPFMSDMQLAQAIATSF